MGHTASELADGFHFFAADAPPRPYFPRNQIRQAALFGYQFAGSLHSSEQTYD
jgi:hypothetical protein